jgi:hypothetical protein
MNPFAPGVAPYALDPELARGTFELTRAALA